MNIKGCMKFDEKNQKVSILIIYFLKLILQKKTTP